jgi:hypothetical protein
MTLEEELLMKSARSRVLVLCVFSAIVLIASSVHGNLAVNGDFELGNTGFTTDFVISPGDIWPPQTYDIVADPHNSHSMAASYFDHTFGDGSGLMMAVNGSTTPNDVVWSQTVDVSPNQTYELAFWNSSWNAPAGLSVRINDVPIADIWTPSANGLWERFSVTWASCLNTSATIDIVNVTTAFGGNDFALDDISFQNVPDPPLCHGDFDKDGDVDGSDLAIFAGDFGSTNCSGECEGDFDGDGDVDGSDLAVFAADFGRTDCPTCPQ